MLKRFFIFITSFMALQAFGETKDTISHWGVTLSGMPSKVVVLDKYQRKWMKKNKNGSIAIEFNHVDLPSEKDSFAKDYSFPSLSIGLRYTMNDKVRMHREQDPSWGLAEEVPYDSHLGNTLSIYGSFTRAIHRTKHWETAYSLSGGFGFNRKWYNKENNIDNELIGTPVLIYFGIGIHQTYRFALKWGIRASLEFVHHSNGALYRPNKGSNTLGPSLGLVYYPYYDELINEKNSFKVAPFKKYWYMDLVVGAGAKTMLEDWLQTQFNTPKSAPDYRTEYFKRYAAFSFQTNLMYRYARRWASGIGFDVFYGTYAEHIEVLDRANNIDSQCSRWSIGIAGKHEVFYHNLSLAVALGGYLYRKMGENAKINESKIYERIGVHYTFPSLNGLKLGINVKAHITKADFTEFIISYPIRFSK